MSYIYPLITKYMKINLKKKVFYLLYLALSYLGETSILSVADIMEVFQ